MDSDDIFGPGEAVSLQDLIGFDPFASAASIAARVAAQEDLRRRRDAERGFAPSSLRDWLALAAASGVDHVPSVTLGEIAVDDLMSYDRDGSEGQGRVIAFLSACFDAVAARRSANPAGRFMARWDTCASAPLKIAMTEGWAYDFAAATAVEIDDERAFETHAHHLPRLRSTVHLRPWVDALVIDGFALEFRVFVRGGAIAGTSNYHVQRPLPRTREIAAAARACEGAALALAAAQRRPLSYLEEDGTYDPRDNSWTADFIVRPDGRPVFLEGGPPPPRRASTCCFRGRPIEGLALAAE